MVGWNLALTFSCVRKINMLGFMVDYLFLRMPLLDIAGILLQHRVCIYL